MFVFLIQLVTFIYIIFILLFIIGLFFPNEKRQPYQYPVAVVIAARNEEKNIARLLSDLTRQTYPQSKYEVIVVDDHSTDNTYAIVQEFSQKYAYVKIIKAVTDQSGHLSAKKNAVSQGIMNSQGEIILTTDADCRVQPMWIETMVSYFTDDVGMVVGFSQMGVKGEQRSVFEQLQAIDFLALLAGAQGSLNLGLPLAATGQNLAYRKKTFEEVGGFQKIGHRLSGDDVLLLQLVYTQTNWNIRFAPSKQTFNHTEPEKTVRGFLNQRKRWASNGSYQFKLNKLFFIIVVDTFLVNLFSLIGIILAPCSGKYFFTILCFLSYKLIIEFLIIKIGARVYQREDLVKFFPIWALLQIPYVVLVGGLGNMTKFIWKGRKN